MLCVGLSLMIDYFNLSWDHCLNGVTKENKTEHVIEAVSFNKVIKYLRASTLQWHANPRFLLVNDETQGYQGPLVGQL